MEETPQDLLRSSVALAGHDWGWTARATLERQIPLWRGKVTGGCSAVNASVAIRGVPVDFDQWAALGNDQWAFEKVCPSIASWENSIAACINDEPPRPPAASASANRYHHIEETRVHRLVVSSNRDSGRSFRSRLLNEQIQYADHRVAFVRSGRVREKNLFSNPGDATDLIEWHMPLVPATIVKRNAVMWNSLSSRR